MALFRHSIVKKYLADLDKNLVAEKYAAYKKHFLNAKTQENIRNSKEEEYQEGFLMDLFVLVLGYTKKPNPDFNLIVESKNAKDSRKADGAIVFEDKIVAVIELKGTKTVDLRKIEEQAFGYKNNQADCTYVITSNFEKLRFYIDNAVEFIEFNLFHLGEKDFEMLYLCLAHESIKRNLPKIIKQASAAQEANVTRELYKDYIAFKNDLFQNLRKNNPQHDALLLFKKSQKLLDRFLFLFFAEDKGLLSPNSTREILKSWEHFRNWNHKISLYQTYIQFFNFINSGIKTQGLDVFAYNGGLFAPDDLLDNVLIDDDLLYRHTEKMSAYDFDSEIDVNILGHIFENSLSEIEEIAAELSGEKIEKTQAKRKKDGVFYTPKFITSYIIESTIGKICQAKKIDIGIEDEAYFQDKKRSKTQHEDLIGKLNTYRTWLKSLTILDPACGSGAFLNEALTFLVAEYEYIDQLEAKLYKETMAFPNYGKQILENNLFGVDINEESVEIAKLSLWLRTAKKGITLNNLNNNIKCGNSLISEPELAGDLAFDWEKEFPQVFKSPHPQGLGDPEGVVMRKAGFDVVIGNPPYVQLQNLKEQSDKLAKLNYQTFEKTGDLYALFYEKAWQLLKENGLLGFITSNKWLRANYGKSLRNFFLKNTQVQLLVDLGSGIFEGATVDSNILIYQKNKNGCQKPFEAFDLSKEKDFRNFAVYENRKVEILPQDEEAWTIANSTEQALKTKIEKAGIPLKDWDISIYRGILTGFNEAFIIDENTKNELIKQDAKSAEIIKPILRGRDIQRYYADFADLYLIATFPALKLDIENYPAVKKYLESFGKKLHQTGENFIDENGIKETSRKKTGNKWFETQDQIGYHQDFEKEKIVWASVGETYYCFVSKNMFLLDTNYFCTFKTDIINRYVLIVLNSKLIVGYINSIDTQVGEFAFRHYKYNFENIPIPKISDEAQEPFIAKADLMIHLNRDLQEKCVGFERSLLREFGLEKLTTKLQTWYALPYSDFLKELEKQKVKLSLAQKSEWESYFSAEKQKAQKLQNEIALTDQEINRMVYALYDLTEEEVALVEA